MEEKVSKKDDQEFKEVKGLKWIIKLAGGLKIDIKRVHIRYEDDYFQHHRPFSFGFMIEHIAMENNDTDWQFETPLSMNFFRQKCLYFPFLTFLAIQVPS